LGHRGSEVERTAFGPLGPIRSLGAQSFEGSRPTDLGGASWVAASATPDMSSEDPALQPPVLEPWWDGDGEGHPHPGMFETDRSVTQSRRNASDADILITSCYLVSPIIILVVWSSLLYHYKEFSFNLHCIYLYTCRHFGPGVDMYYTFSSLFRELLD